MKHLLITIILWSILLLNKASSQNPHIYMWGDAFKFTLYEYDFENCQARLINKFPQTLPAGFSNIAVSLDGTFYANSGVDLYKLDTLLGTADYLGSFNEPCCMVALAWDYDGKLYSAYTQLHSYDTNSGQFADLGPWYLQGKYGNDFGVVHGVFQSASTYNLYEVNLKDLLNGKILGTLSAPDASTDTWVVPYAFNCDSTIIYGSTGGGNLFRFPLNSPSNPYNVAISCWESNYQDFAITPSLQAQKCDLFIDLDTNDGAGLLGYDYPDSILCQSNISPICDTLHTRAFAEGLIDSISINIKGNVDFPLEYLSFMNNASINVLKYSSTQITMVNKGTATGTDFTQMVKKMRYHHDGNRTPGVREIKFRLFSGADSSIAARCYLFVGESPFAGPDLDLSFCEKQAPQDLNQFILTTKNGTWNIANGVFDPAKDKSGTYTYVVNAQSCPNDTALVNITVIPAPSVLLPKDTSFCAGINFIPYDILANGTNLNNLVWQDGTIGLSYTISKPGQYIATADNGQGCTAADTFNVNELPTLNANIQGNHVLCPGTSGVLTASGGTNYLWSNGNTNATLNVTAPGVYSVTVSNAVACPDTASYVIIAPPAIDVDYKISAPVCKGDTNGHVDLFNVISGDEPIVWKILNEQGKIVDPLQVSSGNYLIIATDANNCADSMSIVVPDGEVLDIDLGSDITAKQGQTIQLKAITLSGNPIEFKWSPVNLLDNINYNEASIIANSNVTISVTAKNSNGCTAEDDLNISVNLANDIYVPNAFSPNGDGFNDRLIIYADDKIWHIEKFEVYGRWGQLVYQLEDAAPSNPNFGWNGYSNGQQASEGVYVYSLKMKNVNGKTVVLSGEVLVVK